LERPVIVAMAVVAVVEPPFNQIVRMVAVRDRLVPAIGAVDMVRGVAVGALAAVAAVRIAVADADHMLVDMISVRVVEMPAVQIIDMPLVAHGRMAAARPVGVRMIAMDVVLARH
jgi:hypothetical protein